MSQKRPFAAIPLDLEEDDEGQLLAALGRTTLPATVFVPTDYPDSGRPMGWPGYDRWPVPAARCSASTARPAAP